MKISRITVTIFVILLALGFSSLSLAKQDDNTLTIGGTGAALGGMKLLAKAFHKHNPDIAIKVLPSLGSGGGLKALAAGAIDVAVSARKLKEKEKRAGINFAPYSSTAIVFASSTSNELVNLTFQWLTSTYSAGKPIWPDGNRVRLVLRPMAETDTKMLIRHIPGMEGAIDKARSIPGIPIAITDQETADKLETFPNSLGVAALSLILAENRKLHIFSLNGVSANEESIQSGAYPMIKTFYVATDSRHGTKSAKFLKFLQSNEATQILRLHGHVPHFGKALR